MKLTDYLTVRQAAEETGLQYKTLLKRIAAGSVPAERVGGKMLMVRKSVVNKIKKKSGAS